MNITPRTPKSPFNFTAAISTLFRTPGGNAWAFKLILATGLVLALVYAIGGFLIAAPYLSFIEGIDQLESDPEAVFGMMGSLIPGYFLITIGALAVLVMGETTLHRAVLRKEDTPGIPLRFGKDELRVFGASLGVWLLGIFGFFLFMLAVGILAAIFGMLTPILAGIIMLLGYIAGLLFWPFLVVRLAPAGALTVYNEKAHLMAGRDISKNRFWSLFLAFLFVTIVGYVASSVVSMIGMMSLIGDGSVFLMTGGELGEGSGEGIAQALRDKFSNPLVLIMSLIGVVIYCCVVAAWLLTMAGVGTYAVEWWAEDDEASPFD